MATATTMPTRLNSLTPAGDPPKSSRKQTRWPKTALAQSQPTAPQSSSVLPPRSSPMTPTPAPTRACEEPEPNVHATGCDIYEWEEQGHGTCDEVGGCVSLVSDGVESPGTNLAVISSSGRDISFHTLRDLIPEDTDGVGDIYDARIDGGFHNAHAPPICGSPRRMSSGPAAEPPHRRSVRKLCWRREWAGAPPAAPKASAESSATASRAASPDTISRSTTRQAQRTP